MQHVTQINATTVISVLIIIMSIILVTNDFVLLLLLLYLFTFYNLSANMESRTNYFSTLFQEMEYTHQNE